MLARSLLCPLITIVALALAPRSYSNQTQTQSSSVALTSNTLAYHGGPLLTEPSVINVYLVWYGFFSIKDRNSILDFFASFNPEVIDPHLKPSVLTWWKITGSYKDKAQKPVSRAFRVVKQVADVYSLGKNIRRAQIADVVKNNIKAKRLPEDSKGFYLVLTSKDTIVEKFCRDSCGFHDSAQLSKVKVVYAHVGDSGQCPGFCAWPYAVPAYGPGPALVAPNGVSADGIIINIATVLAGAATNPYKNGYFQGNALAPLEAVSACPGIFGAGAYPGYPGKLIVDKTSKASYNAYGANGKKFLLPAIWDLPTSVCKAVAA
ncbi:hypothetical protein P3X46_003234 [Hevea brasiliensis]|uniref:Uncharacterized protein n=1 Tax=Hevea brasiliensis TaxID=3981 RepID=A0ABQ9N5K3_HEVBR|nr:protein EXORDIUM-like 2 [Hevea brasiliensis]KAJ9187817.1 hypothetical protein P3X46_003234 [Hevea brasiliensis]